MKRSQFCAFVALVALLASVLGLLKAQENDTVDDRDVKVVRFVDLAYPVAAKRARVQGVVVVRVGLDNEGGVSMASAVSGAKVLADASVENAKRWTFKPNPRKSAIIVYDFALDEGACHDDSHSLFRLRHFNLAVITACSPVIVG
jgi:TonB family protein